MIKLVDTASDGESRIPGSDHLYFIADNLLHKLCAPLSLLHKPEYELMRTRDVETDRDAVVVQHFDEYSDAREDFMPKLSIELDEYASRYSCNVKDLPPISLDDVMRGKIYRDIIYPANTRFLEKLDAAVLANGGYEDDGDEGPGYNSMILHKAVMRRHRFGLFIKSGYYREDLSIKEPVSGRDRLVTMRGYPMLDKRMFALAGDGIGYVVSEDPVVRVEKESSNLDIVVSWRMGMVIYPTHSVAGLAMD